MSGAWLRAGVLVGLIAVLALVVVLVGLPDVDDVRSWVDRSGPSALVLLALGTGVALLGPVPRTALSLLAGVAAGFWAGLVVALVGGMLGGLGAFGLGRALGRPAVARLAGPRLARADRFLDARGFWSVLAVRLLPAAPFSVVSYAAGLSAVRFVPYTAATALGLVPSTVLQVGAGASVGTLSRWARLVGTPEATAVLVAVVLLAVAGGVVLVRRKRAGSGQTASRQPVASARSAVARTATTSRPK